MRQFKVMPTNDVVDKICDKYLYEQKEKQPKRDWSSKRFKGKLSPEDVDVIKYLCYRGYNNTHISELFNVSSTTVYRIKLGENFANHVSPYEDISWCKHKTINQTKVNQYYFDNKEFIDDYKSKLEAMRLQ